MNQPATNEIVQRVERLEHQNRRLWRFGTAAVIGVAALGVMAQASAPRTPKTLEAERFILVDQTGKPRAAFVVASDGNIGLRLADKAGMTRLAFEVQANGEPLVTLADSQSHRRVAITVNKGGAQASAFSIVLNELSSV